MERMEFGVRRLPPALTVSHKVAPASARESRNDIDRDICEMEFHRNLLRANLGA
jgi:hypothetical protein